MIGKYENKNNKEQYSKNREDAILKEWEDWAKKVWPDYYRDKEDNEQLHR